MKREIIGSMSDLARNGDDNLCAHFRFSENYIGFQGHFPDHKVLPGISQIHCVQVMLEEWRKEPMHLKEVVRAKYFQPVHPGEEIECKIKDEKITGDECVVKAHITRESETIAQFSLIFSFGLQAAAS